MKKEFQELCDYLRAHKLRVTRTRQLIFQEIVSSPEFHPNVYEIYQRLKKKRSKVSLATVYRTLGLLVRSGMVSQIDLGEDHSHYEPKGPKAGHGHLICLSCGKVTEFSDDNIRMTIGKVGKENAFELDKFSIQVFGYCAGCKK
jgi:Fur family ferric uptake transcriptional regulator